MIELATFSRDDAAMIAAWATLFRAHSRISAAENPELINQYVAASIGAAENYLDRDIATTSRAYSGALPLGYVTSTPSSRQMLVYKFEFWRGTARSVELLDANDVVIDASAYAFARKSAHPKSRGFVLYSESDLGNVTINIESGYASVADVPSDLVAYVLAASGAQYEVREIANYTSTVQDADFLPLHMLNSWRQLSYA